MRDKVDKLSRDKSQIWNNKQRSKTQDHLS